MCEERARVVEPAGVGLLRFLAVGLSLRECDSSVAAISCCLEIHAAVGRLKLGPSTALLAVEGSATCPSRGDDCDAPSCLPPPSPRAPLADRAPLRKPVRMCVCTRANSESVA